MSEERHENDTKKQADRLHEHAQQTGDPYDYTRAAVLYNRCGDYEQERVCLEAADALMKVTR